MDFSELRAVVEHLVKSGLKPKDVLIELEKVHCNRVPSYSTITKWCRELKMFGLTKDWRSNSGRQREVSDEANTQMVKALLDNKRDLTVRQLSQMTGISKSTIHRIITEILGMNKVSSYYVPKILSSGEKLARINAAKEFLDSYESSWANLKHRFITCDETWIVYDPATKFVNFEWRSADEPRPVKPRLKISGQKVMLSIFKHRKGVLVTDFLPKRTKFNGDYYCSILDRVSAVIKSQFKFDAQHPLYLIHDNARPHTAYKTAQKLAEIGLKVTKHPPYSPDISPSDYYLFRDLKNHLRYMPLSDREDAIAKTLEFLDSKSEPYYSRGIDVLPE